ncbi:hypothetical protein U9M48_030797 [Paspalum notatum var. saurae]|uniref:Retroviral polymerase SH3-like domain-containing protein n=1 Tax=Paspalum notatum var. saurae TaxID=547442 RepID=A0AAQ3U1E7_PASNO
MTQLNRLLKHDLVRGLKDVKFEKDKLCSACQARKQVANTHPSKSQMCTCRPLQLLHMDLFGPTTYESIGGNNYCLVIVDDFSRFTWVFFLQDKSSVFDTFKSFAILAQNQLKMISRKTSIEIAMSMLSEYDISHSFWAEAINTAGHASNRVYCHRLLKTTPYELLIGRKPNISYFRSCLLGESQISHTFGSLDANKGSCLSKFEKKCDEGFLLGYSSNSKAYRTHGIVEKVYDVEFDEANGSQEESDNLNGVRGE